MEIVKDKKKHSNTKEQMCWNCTDENNVLAEFYVVFLHS